jgi:S1-C subfamily serine protease
MYTHHNCHHCCMCAPAGPLLDSGGRVVGMCTATFTRSGSVSTITAEEFDYPCIEPSRCWLSTLYPDRARMLTCHLTLQGRGSGVNFALPVDMLREVVGGVSLLSCHSECRTAEQNSMCL